MVTASPNASVHNIAVGWPMLRLLAFVTGWSCVGRGLSLHMVAGMVEL